jgi:Fic family protein
VESLVYEHQTEYYEALQESTQRTDSAPFIAFMLRMILDAVAASAPQVAPQVSELLLAMTGEMSREALQAALGLQDRKSFRERYLKPALDDGLIEMTLPGKPNSRLQKYRLTEQGANCRK